MRMLGLSAIVLLLGGCMQWEELPEGTTGFLTVENAQMSGALGGMDLATGRVTRADGFCTPRGWQVNLATRLPDGSVVENEIEMVDFFWWGTETTFERHAGIDVLVARDDAAAEMGVKALVDGSGSVGTMEPEADFAVVQVEERGFNDLRFVYNATFSTGEQVRGQFDMNMPVTD
jgi:hypothetical protein